MKKLSSTKFNRYERAFEAILHFGHRTQDVRRAAILENVIQIMATEGVDELTFERIGKRSGMARSHVVYYFPDRETLVESAIRFVMFYAQEFIAQRLENETDWQELIRKYIAANFDWISGNRAHASVFYLLYYQASFKARFRRLHTEAREAGLQRLLAILDLSPRKWKPAERLEFAKSIQGLITGNLMDVMATSWGDELEERKHQTEHVIERLMEKYSDR